jgi:hypothetical protein
MSVVADTFYVLCVIYDVLALFFVSSPWTLQKILTSIPMVLRSLVSMWSGSILTFFWPQFIDSDDGCSPLLWNISKRMPDYLRLLSSRRRSSWRSVRGFVLELRIQVIKQRHEVFWLLKWGAMCSGNIPYILKSNPHTFYSFKGLKNQMRITIACGLDSWSRARFWKNDGAPVRAVRTIKYNNLLFYLLFIIIYYLPDSPSSLITE